MLAEFKAFLLKTNALALAVGVIIGAPVAGVVNALVSDIIMPPIGWVLGGVDFSQLVLSLGEGGPQIRYGLFLDAVVSFVVIAFVVFWITRAFIHEQAPTGPAMKECPYCREQVLEAATKCRYCVSALA